MVDVTETNPELWSLLITAPWFAEVSSSALRCSFHHTVTPLRAGSSTKSAKEVFKLFLLRHVPLPVSLTQMAVIQQRKQDAGHTWNLLNSKVIKMLDYSNNDRSS